MYLHLRVVYMCVWVDICRDTHTCTHTLVKQRFFNSLGFIRPEAFTKGTSFQEV